MNSNYTESKKSTIATRSNSGESVADFVFGTHPTHHHNIWFKIVTSTNLSGKAISLKNRMTGNTSEYLYEIIKIAKNSGRSISYDIRFGHRHQEMQSCYSAEFHEDVFEGVE